MPHCSLTLSRLATLGAAWLAAGVCLAQPAARTGQPAGRTDQPAAEPGGVEASGVEPEPIDLSRWPDRRPEVVLPPAWAFGVLYGGYTDQVGTLEKVRRLIELDLPIDAYSIDSWFWDFADEGAGPDGYLDFVGDRDAYPDPTAMWAELERLNVKAGLWFWDRILKAEDHAPTIAAYRDFERRGFLLEPYIQGGWHTDGETLSAHIDFRNPKAAAYFQERVRPFFEMGVDFLKIDAGATLAYMQTAFEATQRFGLETDGRGFIMSHANMGEGEADDPMRHRFPTKWTGDAAVRWTQPSYPDTRSWRLGGLREQIRIFTDADDKGGYPFLAMDTGGFAHGEPSDELFRRWSQFGTFTPIMWVFGAADTRESNTPYRYDRRTLDGFREHTHLRMRLFPYIYSHAHLSRLTGDNMMRRVGRRVDQYLFGDAFLVAPVYEPGVEARHVSLPAGVWIDFWTGERHDQGELGTTRLLDVDPDRVPLFVRDGAIVPMRPYARSVELGSNETLDLHVWPSGQGRFHLFEDDGRSNGYLRGFVTLTEIRSSTRELADGGVALTLNILPVEGGYDGMLERRTYRVLLRDFEVDPETVSADPGVGGVAYDAMTRTSSIELEVDTRDGALLRVRGTARPAED